MASFAHISGIPIEKLALAFASGGTMLLSARAWLERGGDEPNARRREREVKGSQE